MSAPLRAQQNLLDDLMKTADSFNQKLLELTALSEQEENDIGAELQKKILKGQKTVNEKNYDVKKIFSGILKYSKRKLKYEYRIIKDKDVNAYAILGGRIFINSAVLDFVSNENELAFIIAHEIAHNELKHCVKKVQYAARVSQINPVFGAVVQTAYSVYKIPFTKYEESEADELGVRLMLKAGYKKDGAISFMDKLGVLEKKYGEEDRTVLNDFISSHPTAEERKKKIKDI
ncbi:MAG: M48 family metallopeptidase [Ignavibacteria bacterium]